MQNRLVRRTQPSLTKVPHHEPSRHNGEGPEAKVEVDGADLGKELDRREAVAHGLPGRLGAAEQGGVANHLGLAVGEIGDDEVSGCARG